MLFLQLPFEPAKAKDTPFDTGDWSLEDFLTKQILQRVRMLKAPDPENPILQMPHVILSPHNASASARFDPARRRRVGQELALVLGGRWPMSCVNPTVLPNSGLRRWQPIAMDRGPNS